MEREEVAEQGHEGNNAHHGLADEGEDGEEKDGLGIQVQRVDLVMRDYGVEEIGKGRNQACQEGVEMNQDLSGHHVDHGAEAGQATAAFHSLESAMSVGRTLSSISRLTIVDHSRAGSKASGDSVGAQFFTFFFFANFGAMSTGES